VRIPDHYCKNNYPLFIHFILFVERAAAEPRTGGELARRSAVGSSRWLGRAQRGPASGWEQPPPVEPTRKRRLNEKLIRRGRGAVTVGWSGLLAASLAVLCNSPAIFLSLFDTGYDFSWTPS
jgi:hypothetical protein